MTEIATTVVREIEREHALVCTQIQKAAEHAANCGRLLREVRDQLKEEGNFTRWLRDNIPFSQSHAYRYMDIAAAAEAGQLSHAWESTSQRAILTALGKPVEQPKAPPETPLGRLQAAGTRAPIIDAEVIEDDANPRMRKLHALTSDIERLITEAGNATALSAASALREAAPIARQLATALASTAETIETESLTAA